MALSQAVCHFSHQPDQYMDLVNVSFQFDWHLSPSTVGAFQHYLIHLISFNGTFILPTIRLLIKQFLPSKMFQHSHMKQMSLDLTEAKKLELYTRQVQAIHQMIRSLLHVAPSMINHIFPVLQQLYPHQRLPGFEHTAYVQQLLHMIEYLPTLEEAILSVIVESLVKIDVRCDQEGDIRL